VDTALTLYVNGDNGLHIGDGVNQPTQLASNTFTHRRLPNGTMVIAISHHHLESHAHTHGTIAPEIVTL